MSILKKGSKAYSILNMKCPKCNEGDLFETSTFSFQKSFYMPQHCPACGQRYYLGPGFYFGAMFISYILTAFFCLGFMGLMMFGFGMNWKNGFMLLLAVVAILFVWFFRISRSIWINLNVGYDPRAVEKFRQKAK